MFITKLTPSLEVATGLASAGFVQSLSSTLREDVENHLREGQIIYSTLEHDQVVGMSIFTAIGARSEILYLVGTIFLPRVQQRGLAAEAIHVARAECGSEYLALRTQSPRMWSVGNKLCRDWYPNVGIVIPSSMQEIGERVSRKIDSAFPFARGQYRGPLYGAKPTHHDPVLQQWWDRICDFDRGDAVLCVGRF